MMRRWQMLGLFLVGWGSVACTVSSPTDRFAQPDATDVSGFFREQVFSVDTALFDRWTLIAIRGEGVWRLGPGPGGELAIVGVADQSATAIHMDTDIDPVGCPILEWEWSVGSVQSNADLTGRETDDVAAALFVLFGDAGTPLDPQPVPTLRYVWTNDRHAPGEVIANPYLPDTVQNIVVRTGEDDIGHWRMERRDILSDYETAFGEPPDDFVWSIALFVDNDQTGEPAEALFRSASIYCH